MDLTQSTIAAMKDAFGGDKGKVDALLHNMKSEEEEKVQERKIAELQQQFQLPRDQIVVVLKQNKWDVEECFVPLLQLKDSIRQKELEEQRRRRDLQIQQEKEGLNKKQIQTLMEMFRGLPQDEVLQLLKNNDGDVEETAVQLTTRLHKMEESKRELEEQKKKEAMELREKLHFHQNLTSLKQKFTELSEELLEDTLKKHNGDLGKALSWLFLYVENLKVFELCRLFPSFAEEEVKNALIKAKQDKKAAIQLLSEEKKQREVSKQPIEHVVEPKLPTIIPQKIEPELMERSIMFAEVTKKEIAMEAEKKKELVTAEVRDKIADIVGRQALDLQNQGLPGLKPAPTVHEIQSKMEQPVIEEAKVRTSPSGPGPVSDSHISTDKKEQSTAFVILKPKQTRVDVGQKIEVEYEFTSGTSTPNDWIAIYNIERSGPKEYLTYVYRAKEERVGVVTFDAPEYGEYEFKYYSNKSFHCLAISPKVKVGPEFTLEHAMIDNDKKIALKWNQTSGNTYTKAWVGLFSKSQTNNKSYIKFEYLTKKEITFDVPVKPGEYEFRLFTTSYVDVAKSSVFIIRGEDKMIAEFKDGKVTVDLDIVSVDPSQEGVWVGLYFVGADDGKFRRSQYVSQRKSSLVFNNSPKTAGTYEARLFSGGRSYIFVMKSNSFVISAPPSTK